MHQASSPLDRDQVQGGSAAVLRLQSEITQTRNRMENTMQKLSRKLDGGKDAVEWADHCLVDWENGVGTAIQHMKKHPLPYAVAGVGIGWVICRAFMDREEEPLKERLGHAASDASERVSNSAHVIAEEARETAGAVKEIVGDAVDDVARRARKATGQMADSAHEVKQRVEAEVKDSAAKLRKSVDEKQLAIGAGLLAAGVIAGLLLPRTRREDQLLGPSRDHLKDHLKEAGQGRAEGGG